MQPNATPCFSPVSAPAPALRDDAEALHEAVSALVRIYQYRDRDRICCHDISVTQCHALEALAEHGALRSQTLAAHLRLDKSTTTRVIDALVRKHYVSRRPAPDDARAVQLEITASGTALYVRIRDELVVQQEQLLVDLDPAARRAAIGVIQRLAQAAQRRFDAGVSVGAASTCCAPVCSP